MANTVDAVMFNTHAHVFTNRYLPRRTLSMPGLVRVLVDWGVGRRLAPLAERLWPFSDSDILDRIAALVLRGDADSQRDLFDQLRSVYPSNTRFVLLSMDFEHMGAGSTACGYSFTRQLDDLARLKESFPDQALPFIAADPRRPGLTALVKRYVEEEGFCGIKIYPPFGYFPDDERLLPVYEYAQKNNLPILGHAMAAAPFTHTRACLRSRVEVTPRFPTAVVQTTRGVASYYAHPRSYQRLLDNPRFRDLKLCLGHAGGIGCPPGYRFGTDGWYQEVVGLLRAGRYPNLYVDLAFGEPSLPFVTRVLDLLGDSETRTRVLFGSDYYLNSMVTEEDEFLTSLRHSLGPTDFEQIARVNPRAYLKSSVLPNP